MQKIIFFGNMGKDPQSKFLDSGTQLCSFSVAAQSGWGDYKQTNWMNCTAWGKKAEVINQHFTKGDAIYIEGELQGDNGNPRTYERGDGSVGASFDVKVTEFSFMPGGQVQQAAGPDVGDGEDMPF